MASQGVQGRFMWYDLMTTDPKAAQEFYGKVVGWGTQPFDGGMEYEMWTTEHGPIGGVMELPEGSRQSGEGPSWLCYIGAADVDAAAKQVSALGGKILKQPADIPGVGRFAIASDPFGGVFALYTPKEEPAELAAWPQPGDFSWHELMSSDSAGAFDFYSKLCGWEPMGEMDMGEMGVYRMYGKGGQMYGGMMTQSPSYWAFYALVDDADAATARAEAAGGKVMVPPMDVPGGDRVAVIADPQGAVFGVHGRAR